MGRVLFPSQFEQLIRSMEADVDTAQALFSGQRMEKQGLSSQRNFSSPTCSRDLILNSEDKRVRSEAKDGEAYALVYWGKDGASSRGVVLPPFILFFFLVFNLWSWPPVSVLSNMLM